MDRVFKSSYSKSFILAAGFHTALLFGSGWALSQKAEFGMEVGRSNIEVDLIAAPPEAQTMNVSSETKTEPKIEPIIKPPAPDDFVLPQKIEEQPKPIIEEKPKVVEEAPKSIITEKSKLVVKNQEPSPYKGDGSSPKPDRDETTIHSMGGAVTVAKPDYLKNPPPPYPDLARRLGQEGLVLLSAELNTEGTPASVKVKESSGFQSLDNAAVKAVQKWRFAPARVGSLAITSHVDIPIRFQINNSR